MLINEHKEKIKIMKVNLKKATKTEKIDLGIFSKLFEKLLKINEENVGKLFMAIKFLKLK